MMIRAKGKLLQCYRMGHRGFSSAIEKEAHPSGKLMKIGENLIGFAYKAAVGGVGFVIGGLATTSEAPKVVEAEETVVKLGKRLDVVIAQKEALEELRARKKKLIARKEALEKLMKEQV